MKRKIDIQNNCVGKGFPVFIIAEIGVNHNGSLKIAKKLVSIAKESGADAVKFQTFKTEKLVSKFADKAEYQKTTTLDCDSHFNMLKTLEFSEKDFHDLSEYANELGIIFLSSPFDIQSVDLLNKLKIPAFKISSGELTNLSLLEYVAKKGKPVILSTGMSTLNEIEDAFNLIKKSNVDIILLHCISEYPANIEKINLRTMETLEKNFKTIVGYSDHTLGLIAPIIAVSLGAAVIEKHLTLDKSLSGPDHSASLEPEEFKRMVNLIRLTEKALGNGCKSLTEKEMEIKLVSTKSIVCKQNIPKGTIIQEKMVTIKRPGTGIRPKYLGSIIGRVAKKDLKKDHVIKWEMLD